MRKHWIADRMHAMEVSGIRRAFELGKSMTNPIDLSIGLPDFPVPDPIRAATIAALEGGYTAYTLTQGLPELREQLTQRVRAQVVGDDREVIVTAGTGGALTLALCAVVNPGDEVIIFDPYFVMYRNLVTLAGGTSVLVSTYPDFQIDPDRLAAAITPNTKCVLLNSPNNPTGAVARTDIVRAVADLCAQRGVLLISDEVYRGFSYDQPCPSPAAFNPEVLVVDGFSKAYAMTGLRLGYAHGPARLINEMAKLQQFTFICAPSIVQKGGLAALEVDITPYVTRYRNRRNRVVQALQSSGLYDVVTPEGAFYAFPRVPTGWPNASAFVQDAVHHNLLIIPGNVFSTQDTHFRISYAVAEPVLERGLDVLVRMVQTANHPR